MMTTGTTLHVCSRKHKPSCPVMNTCRSITYNHRQLPHWQLEITADSQNRSQVFSYVSKASSWQRVKIQVRYMDGGPVLSHTLP